MQETQYIFQCHSHSPIFFSPSILISSSVLFIINMIYVGYIACYERQMKKNDRQQKQLELKEA